MDFLMYLDKIEKEIIILIEKAGYSTEENTSLCLQGNDYVGFFKKRQKKVIICTNNAIKREGYKNLSRNDKESFERTAIHIKKAIRHEAVHVAQDCNNGKPLEMKKNLTMNKAKIHALKGSSMISGENEKEIQAYILEDKPKMIRKELKKYCI